MGAGQSRDGDGAGKDATVKTSYYQLLAIDRNATEDEVKKAYRRKALELHPDRNFGNVEEATSLFAEVQSAYEVLSDPQERAWYDSHESAILRGDDPMADGAGDATFEGSVKVTSADDIARMIRKFNSKVDFTDAPSGFFGFLRETFDQLAKEEQIAARLEGLAERDYPSFGHKDDEYADVVKPFYAFWAGFGTQKSFNWKDRYRLSEAPDRRYRRAMEKENQKFRDEGIREFNDAVRSLIAFIRKRDPRVKKTEQSEAERQRVLQEAARAQAIRARKRNEEMLSGVVPDWAQVVSKDELEGEIEDSESDEEHFECVACRKIFKSEKQWEAHERSKKHQKAIQALKRQMRKDEQRLELDDTAAATPLGSAEEEELPTVGPTGDYDSDNDSLAERTGDLALKDDSLDHIESSRKPAANDADDDDNSDHLGVSKSRGTSIIDEDEGGGDSDASLANSATSLEGATVDEATIKQHATAAQPKMGKAAQKRAKKAAAAAVASTSADANKHVCGVCKTAFPSKRSMFQHIEDHGHALPKTTTAAPAKGSGKKGRR